MHARLQTVTVKAMPRKRALWASARAGSGTRVWTAHVRRELQRWERAIHISTTAAGLVLAPLSWYTME
jgi:hypothetical protein